MSNALMQDLETLVPKPVIHRIAGQEIRQAPIPMKRLLEVIRYVEGNTDLLGTLDKIGKPADQGGVSISQFFEGDLCKRINALVRLLLPGHEQTLTDEWCLEHLSMAHYVAFVRVGLVQNQLYEVFTRAKGLIMRNMDEALRQKETVKAA
jgi:hypothetical protein